MTIPPTFTASWTTACAALPTAGISSSGMCPSRRHRTRSSTASSHDSLDHLMRVVRAVVHAQRVGRVVVVSLGVVGVEVKAAGATSQAEVSRLALGSLRGLHQAGHDDRVQVTQRRVDQAARWSGPTMRPSG